MMEAKKRLNCKGTTVTRWAKERSEREKKVKLPCNTRLMGLSGFAVWVVSGEVWVRVWVTGCAAKVISCLHRA